MLFTISLSSQHFNLSIPKESIGVKNIVSYTASVSKILLIIPSPFTVMSIAAVTITVLVIKAHYHRPADHYPSHPRASLHYTTCNDMLIVTISTYRYYYAWHCNAHQTVYISVVEHKSKDNPGKNIITMAQSIK